MLTLQAMSASSFEHYAQELVADYAKDNIVAGRWADADAPARSKAALDALLPKGIQTPGHYIMDIVDAGRAAPVGRMWYADVDQSGERIAYLYNIWIDPALRGQGHAREALRLLETEVAALGLRRIGLHVFGFNLAAQAMYRSMGYGITGMNMIKLLREDEP